MSTPPTPGPARPSIATLTVMRGELEQLARMLPSVAWADERHIVETGADVAATARAADGARVHHNPLPLGVGFDDARAAALGAIESDWILIVDTDERITPLLVEVLRARAEEWASSGVAGVWIPRLNRVFDTPLKFCSVWPDYQLRFLRRDAVSFHPTLHSGISVTGPTDRLAPVEAHAIQHHNFRSTAQFIDKLNVYSTIEADQRPSLPPVPLSRAFLAAGREFLARYVKMQGFRDGAEGVHYCTMFAIYRYLEAAKRWERSRKAGP